MLEIYGGFPAELFQPAAVHELPESAVGLAGVEFDFALVADDFGHDEGGFLDRQVAAVANVDVAEHGLGVGVVGELVQVHDEDAGGSHVVDVQEFAVRGAGAPQGDFAALHHGADVGGDFTVLGFVGGNTGAVAGLGEFAQVELADHRRQHMAVGEVVIVAGAVEVGRHDAAVVAAVLAVVAFAELDAGDLGDGVGFVGGFEYAGKQSIFAHGLRYGLGVDAAGAEEEQLLHVVGVRGLDDVGFDHQVFVDELRRVGVVGVDAADLGSGEVDLFGLFGSKEGVDGSLVGQIKLGVGAGDDVLAPGGLELADDGRADHATVAGDVDFGLFAHDLFNSDGFGKISWLIHISSFHQSCVIGEQL